MKMTAAVNEVGADVKAAMDEAAEAYDALIAELKAGANADADVVLHQSSEMCTSWLKIWANLMLAPAKFAAVITSDDAT
jgi:hypothetical protein